MNIFQNKKWLMDLSSALLGKNPEISLCGHVSRIFAFATICEFIYIHCTVDYMFHCIYPGINNTLLYFTLLSLQKSLLIESALALNWFNNSTSKKLGGVTDIADLSSAVSLPPRRQKCLI